MLDNDVLGFDIPVYDFESVQIPNGLTDLLYYITCGLFREPSFFLENLIELPRRAQL
jgi:hypothetical protein